jgi:hypothetical protein
MHRVRVIPFATVPLTSETTLVLSPMLEKPTEITSRAVEILRMCDASRTVGEHVNEIVSLGHFSDRASVSRVVESLVDLGLLTSWAPPHSRVAATSTKSIRMCGVMTADRPQALRRCLESSIQHFQTHGRHLVVVVFDDSRRNEAIAENIEIVALTARKFSYDVRYVGVAERARLRNRMKARGIAAEVADFALTTNARALSTGANRNAFLMLAAGMAALSVDDDTVCCVWTRNGARDALKLCGHGEPATCDFFASREDALASVLNAVNADLLAEHERLLGRSLLELCAPTIDVTEACNHVVASVDRQDPAWTVRLTFPGVVGDNGMETPISNLFRRGPTRAHMAVDRTKYEMALSSRETARVADQPSVSHASGCIALCMGVDASEELPPFFPHWRNQDGAFAATLGQCDPGALFGHLRYGIVHGSERSALYDEQVLNSVGETRMADLLAVLVQRAPSPLPHRGRRTTRVADWLIEVGGLPLCDFVAYAHNAVIEARCAEYIAFDARESRLFSYPKYWSDTVARYRNDLRRRIDDPVFCIPRELRSVEGDTDEAWSRAQSLIRRFGELLAVWGEVWQIAKTHSLDGAA